VFLFYALKIGFIFKDLKTITLIKIDKFNYYNYKLMYTYITNNNMDFTNMSIRDFIEYVITFDNVDDIIDNCETQAEKGFVFERLFDIIIKFGFCDIFRNSNYNHLIGNSNNGKLKILKNLNKYLG
jgi:hypothetical protein